MDPTSAVISGAQVSVSDGQQATTDAAGHFIIPCVSATSILVTVTAEGFDPTSKSVKPTPQAIVRPVFQLAVAGVTAAIQVEADSGADTQSAGATRALSADDIQRLPDDPDDLLRVLRALASDTGGNTAATQVYLDGFQSGSAMPPKSSIASIRINPDIFLPEYQNPLWNGGRIEITTKPGTDTFHGALFFTDSAGAFNATDPFSSSSTPAAKRRFGAEFSGPIVKKKSDFAFAFEKRTINEFGVVNAVKLDSTYAETPFHQTVPADQDLWIASARADWQVTPRNLSTLSFAANVNSLSNQGVGGLVLPEAGYSSHAKEYDLRFTNAQTISPNALHESRVGFSWKHNEQDPNAGTPALQVSGFFQGGGSVSQKLNDRERDLEIDDDVLLSRGRHTLKFGVQSLGEFIHEYNPNTFNGAYVFGGGSAPALNAQNQATTQTTSISGIEQYRRALLNLPGGAATTYQVTTGTPLVPLTIWQVGFFGEDTFRVAPRVTLSTGLRYQFQTLPASYENFRPRIGLSWSPDKQEKWALHLRAGLFTGLADPSVPLEVYRLNGIRQQQTTVYSAGYTDPLTATPGSIRVTTLNRFSRSFGQVPNMQVDAVLEHDFSHHWHATASYNFGAEWEGLRIINVNAPMVASETGAAPNPTAALQAPRPLAQSENLTQYQTYGHYRGAYAFVSLDQTGYKRFTLHLSYSYLDFVGNSPTPQSSYSDRGESGRPDWMTRGGPTVLGSYILPYKLELSSEFSYRPGRPYNITTGTDANGDGNFNDRPARVALPGDGVYATHFGLLTSSVVNGDVPYNLGTMQGTVHLDSELSRAFVLNPQDKDHPRTLTFNARSANLLNHTNVTAVNTVLSSANLGQAVAAEPARRVEFGVRFSL